MKKKQLILILSLIAAAAILTVVCVVLLSDDRGVQRKNGLIVVNEVNPDNIVGIAIETQSGKTEMIKENGVWYFSGRERTETDQLLVESALTQLSYVYASGIVAQEVSDYAPFELDKPGLKVTLKARDGTICAYTFGAQTTDKAHYYMTAQDDPKLYLFPAGGFEQIYAGLMAVGSLGLDIDVESLEEIRFTREGRIEVKMTLAPEEERGGGELWRLESPFMAEGNVRVPELLAALLTPPRLYGYAGDSVEQAYGLDDPPYRLHLKDTNGNALDIAAGGRADDGSYYCLVAGKEGVYKIYAAFEELFRIDISNCVRRDVLAPDEKNSFELFFGGHTIVFDAEAKTLNGTALSQEQVRSLMEAAADVTFDGLTEDGALMNPAGGIIINGARTISFTQYKDDFLAVMWYEGSAPVYLRRDKLEAFIRDAEELAAR